MENNHYANPDRNCLCIRIYKLFDLLSKYYDIKTLDDMFEICEYKYRHVNIQRLVQKASKAGRPIRTYSFLVQYKDCIVEGVVYASNAVEAKDYVHIMHLDCYFSKTEITWLNPGYYGVQNLRQWDMFPTYKKGETRWIDWE